MGLTVKCLTKVKVDNISLVRCVDYIVEYNKQLLDYGSVFKKAESKRCDVWVEVMYCFII